MFSVSMMLIVGWWQVSADACDHEVYSITLQLDFLGRGVSRLSHSPALFPLLTTDIGKFFLQKFWKFLLNLPTCETFRSIKSFCLSRS